MIRISPPVFTRSLNGFFVKECRKQTFFWTLRSFFNVKSRHLCIENDCMRMGPKNEKLQKNLEILIFLGRFPLVLEDDLHKAFPYPSAVESSPKTCSVKKKSSLGTSRPLFNLENFCLCVESDYIRVQAKMEQ